MLIYFKSLSDLTLIGSCFPVIWGRDMHGYLRRIGCSQSSRTNEALSKNPWPDCVQRDCLDLFHRDLLAFNCNDVRTLKSRGYGAIGSPAKDPRGYLCLPQPWVLTTSLTDLRTSLVCIYSLLKAS